MIRVIVGLLSIVLLSLTFTIPAYGKEARLAPLKVLYVTSVGWFHDYERQAELVTLGISPYLNIRFDVIVGEPERLRETDFAAGYDVLVYNFCHASRNDLQLVENLARPVREQGIPLLAMHCTMHSFQNVEPWYEFLGLKTLRHEELRPFTLKRSQAHPVTAGLAFPWVLQKDELYINIVVDPASEALISAWGAETGRDHIQAWIHPVADTPVLGTTLGHSEETLADPQFVLLLARGLAYLTGRLGANGEIVPAAGCAGGCQPDVHLLTQNVRYPTEAERGCVLKALFASSDPWPAPEDLWPACRGAKEVSLDR